MVARYGVAAAKLPTPKMRICWIKAPPDFPSGFPMTSMAAFPLVFCSLSSGMYAISLHGSKSEYLLDLLRMFCAAPTSTASINGVVPSNPATGAMAPENMLSMKKERPVTPIMVGVTRAPARHPNLEKIVLPRSIITNVTVPVADEKLPMKAEYSFGFGNACFNLAFQLTSTKLMHMPYEITSKAKSRMYGLLTRYLADSLSVIRSFFFFALDGGSALPDASRSSLMGVTTLSCMYLYVAHNTPPDASTAPIK
mmetsp:Transcript_23673/g.66857  ORF Transcript_23673/g.66857 Transcript_23673/m.66857 type:complete len:253 (+) Transcript_23673:223-981(+)